MAVPVRKKNSTVGKNNLKRCNDAPQNGLSEEHPKIRVNPNESDRQRHGRLRRMQRALAAYGRYGTVSAACRRAGVNRSTWNRWRSTYSWFDQAVADKHAYIGDELEFSADDCVAETIQSSRILRKVPATRLPPRPGRDAGEGE